jgi:hypothetical protein
VARADWAGLQAAAAGGADVKQDVVGAIGAVGALVAADASVDRRRGQVDVAQFAIGAKLKHANLLAAVPFAIADGRQGK